MSFLKKVLLSNKSGKQLLRQRKYHFQHEWNIEAPVGIVWEVVSGQENWSSILYGFSVTKTDKESSSLSTNGRYFITIKGSLPYSLSINARILSIKPEKSLVVKIYGDLNGICKFDINPKDEKTNIFFDMNVSVVKWWMRIIAPAAEKFFTRNHNLVVNKSYNSFKNRIAMEMN